MIFNRHCAAENERSVVLHYRSTPKTCLHILTLQFWLKYNDDGMYSKNGASTLSRVNFSGYVGHVTIIFSRILTIIACYLVIA